MKQHLQNYDKKNKFDKLNNIVVSRSKRTDYTSLAEMGDDNEYDFVELTEKILKEIGINYSSVTPDDLQSIRNVLAQRSGTPSRTSSISSRRSSISSRSGTRKKRSRKYKKRSRRSKKRSKKRSRRSKKRSRRSRRSKKRSNI